MTALLLLRESRSDPGDKAGDLGSREALTNDAESKLVITENSRRRGRDDAAEAKADAGGQQGKSPRFVFIDASTRTTLHAGSILWASGDTGWQVAGEVDAGGAWTLDVLAAGESPQCLIVSEGYVPTRFSGGIWNAADGSEDQIVAVDPALTLRGNVRINGGIPVPAGVVALAWPQSEPNPTARSHADLLDDPCVLHAQVAPDGSFAIEGASASERYSVTAGGSGWVSTGIERG